MDQGAERTGKMSISKKKKKKKKKRELIFVEISSDFEGFEPKFIKHALSSFPGDTFPPHLFSRCMRQGMLM
jgi:hypothetical protein